MNLFPIKQLLTTKRRRILSFFSSSVFFLFLGIILLSPSTTLSAKEIVAKIGDQEVSLKKFQSFVNTQIFINSYDNLQELLLKQHSSKSKLLQSFIDHTLLFNKAKEEGINKKTPSVEEALKNIKENWIVSLYLSKQIDIMAISEMIDEKRISAEYAKLPQSQTKPFSQLDNREKQQIGQLVFAKLSQEKKDQLRKKLSKKYKASIKGVDKKVVFSIGKKKYSQEAFKKYFQQQLQRIGISLALLKARQPEKYKEISETQLNDMVLYELVSLEIEKKKFEKEKEVKNGLALLIEQLVVQDFLQKKIVSKIEVSEKELNDAFSQLSKRDPSINNMLPLEQERITKDFVRKNKMPSAIEEYLTEIKERSVIQRFKEVLKKVK